MVDIHGNGTPLMKDNSEGYNFAATSLNYTNVANITGKQMIIIIIFDYTLRFIAA